MFTHFFALLIGLLGISSCTSGPPKELSHDIQVTEVLVGAKQQEEYSSEPPVLDGTWKSPLPERAGNGRYSIRELRFFGPNWEMKYTLADSKSMSKPLFTYKATGTYQLQNSSRRIPGAYLIIYRFQKKNLEILVQDKKIRKEFGFDSCQGISSGENDISTHGCGLFPRISECQVDYDLIRQKENKLEIGDRYAEFTSCTEDKRPVAMGFTLEKEKE